MVDGSESASGSRWNRGKPIAGRRDNLLGWDPIGL